MAGLRRAGRAAMIGVALAMLGLAMPAAAQEQGQLFATQEDGYARMILSFPGRDDLPKYEMRIENGVLSIEFEEQVSIILPDVGVTMAPYLSVARVDPDGRGLRMGLRTAYNFNRIEAGEKLFIDLLPTDWQGMPPALPQEIIDELAERARLAAIRAERERKAAEVEALNPQAIVRVGRNATFMRLQFDWTVPTTAEFVQEGETAHIAFEWPVGVDMRDLSVDLPPEVASVETSVSPDGSLVTLQLAAGVTPRFYEISPRQYVLDVDIAGIGLPSFTAASLADGIAQEPEEESAGPDTAKVGMLYPEGVAKSVTPFVSVLGSTVRVVFPFEQDTPAAVFRRGDTVWMIFDTVSGIRPPVHSEELDALASEFAVVTSGDTQVVRVELSQDRLATLGSEGMAWVLSLGDIMLTPTEPINLSRRRDLDGVFEVVADVVRPGRIHDFRDPLVGDLLKVVTAYPPARGVTRTLDYVEFSALRSVHGLVIKPKSPELALAIESELAVLSTSGGLTVSAHDAPRNIGNGITETLRGSYVDLAVLEEKDFGALNDHVDALLADAADGEGRARDVARLDLAQYYTANRFAHEALGVLDVMESDLEAEDLTRKMRMTRAIASTLAVRPAEALSILNANSMGQEVDALLWRTIARVDAYDFKGARADAVEANGIAENYPLWVRNKFYFAAVRAAVETDDMPVAERFLDQIEFASLDPEQASLFHLLSGRVDEARGRVAEAIDTYGQVIAADIRPTRAEAIYRTLRLLNEQGTLDLAKATQTLSAEALLWRGNPLEADMQAMLANFYFRDGDYRLGFETVQQAVANYPESRPITELRDEAQRRFGELFLDGVADSLGPIDALGLYYDFRQLTPPGARGDEMIRNLARRLVRVDLLAQAAELLEYQLENRLRGVARTQIAADLAIIYLADRRPQDAIRVLNATRLPDLPESLQRQRRILEARAMIDGGRDQLALDLLRDLDGRDANLLRIDAHWKAKRYDQASEMLEALYADQPEGVPLSQTVRMGLIKAGVGFVLAGDQFGLSRLRSKFGDAMVTTPEWPMFDLVTGQIQVTSLEFKAVASQVSGVDGINAFLASYRDTYAGEGALAPLSASEPSAGVALAS
ncbi:tetratricopeptide repeat protein [Devosia sp.]|uniref:tetratricopeptide repeat protein n=1 Tax=Devosia sp. TaxID=1871048 RepID=UPI002FCAC65E